MEHQRLESRTKLNEMAVMENYLMDEKENQSLT